MPQRWAPNGSIAMILSDVRDYLKQRGQCSLSDIALHFNTDTETIRGMLDIWIKKGKVEKRSATSACGTSCQSCDPASTEIYFWREANITNFQDCLIK